MACFLGDNNKLQQVSPHMTENRLATNHSASLTYLYRIVCITMHHDLRKLVEPIVFPGNGVHPEWLIAVRVRLHITTRTSNYEVLQLQFDCHLYFTPIYWHQTYPDENATVTQYTVRANLFIWIENHFHISTYTEDDHRAHTIVSFRSVLLNSKQSCRSWQHRPWRHHNPTLRRPTYLPRGI